ncbi:MAG: tetratricopeptide repeat protein [Chitinophagaceae bacterium]
MDKIKKLQEYLERQPEDTFLMHALALEYVKINDLQAAKAWFERVLTIDPGYTGTYYHLAKLLETLGAKEDAIRVYEQGMEACTAAGDQHAYRELQAAYEDLIY